MLQGTYKGKGTLSYGKDRLKTEFELHASLDMNIEIIVSKDAFSKDWLSLTKYTSENEIPIFSLVGSLDNKYEIRIDRMIASFPVTLLFGKPTQFGFRSTSPVEFKMPEVEKEKSTPMIREIRYLISNLEYIGSEITPYEGGGFRADKIDLKIENFDFTIKQRKEYDEAMVALKNKTLASAITAEVIFKTDFTNSENVKATKEIVENICYLLSFAKSCTVSLVGEQFFDGDNLVYQELYNARSSYCSGKSVISHMPPEELKKFLMQCYPTYKKYKDSLKLNVLFEYCVLMKSNLLLEVRILLGYVLLECLSDNAQQYFKSLGTPIENNMKAKKIARLKELLPEISPETFSTIVEEFVYPHPTLPDCMSRVMTEFKMNYKKGEADIWSKRKLIIHKGIIDGDANKIYQDYTLLANFINRSLLSILGYKGEFLNVSKGYSPETMP